MVTEIFKGGSTRFTTKEMLEQIAELNFKLLTSLLFRTEAHLELTRIRLDFQGANWFQAANSYYYYCQAVGLENQKFNVLTGIRK